MNDALKEKLTMWAHNKMLGVLDAGQAPEDEWFEVDASIPELAGMIDVNIYLSENQDGEEVVKAVAYDLVDTPEGYKKTCLEHWVELF